MHRTASRLISSRLFASADDYGELGHAEIDDQVTGWLAGAPGGSRLIAPSDLNR